jgi:PKHD-type hydroxylase
MKAEWQLWANESNLIDKATCAEIINLALQIPPKEGTTGGGKINQTARRSQVRWLSGRNEEFKPVHELIEHRIRKANRNVFGLDINYLPPLQFTTYESSELGHFDWHHDVFFSDHNRERSTTTHRKLSAVLQLSDPESYEGGDFELEAYPPPGIEFKKQGAMLVFPSLFRHRVTPVTKGVRHTLVAWMEGPYWR